MYQIICIVKSLCRICLGMYLDVNKLIFLLLFAGKTCLSWLGCAPSGGYPTFTGVFQQSHTHTLNDKRVPVLARPHEITLQRWGRLLIFPSETPPSSAFTTNNAASLLGGNQVFAERGRIRCTGSLVVEEAKTGRAICS